MDDISEKLAEILNDPESMNRVRLMAESMLGDKQTQQQNNNKQGQQSAQNSDTDFSDAAFDANQLAKIMSVMKQLKNSGNDSRANLLLALKPLLSAPRQEKVDTALKLLKIVDMLPLIKGSGLFDF